ncbi:MAG: hypothetical protein BVN35_05935 [Proteobacteria bacterium ST_bin11]|nr:MAG: hypothetical protein BVN35_05935 [Proteobacteria bacterium ST_bin11]
MSEEPTATSPETTVVPDFISLKVVSSDGQEVHFKIRKATPLLKMMNAYCQRKCQSPTSIRFIFDGQRISDTATAESMNMEDGDTIDALLQQTGGCL